MQPEEALEAQEVQTESPDPETAKPAAGDASGPAGEPEIREALKNVFDPELGINIVDLGLVYEVNADDGKVHIVYSLTTMGCPIGPLIEQQMSEYVSNLPGVSEFTAEMVLRPAWSPEMMSDEAKAALGVF